MKNKFAITCFLILLSFVQAKAQAPFYNDIQQFKKQDSIHFPAKLQILFVGSSSFTKWTDIQNYFPSYPIINRGFGGSSLTDVIHFANDIIFPYQPKQIVIYCGENDLAGEDTTVTSSIVFNRFKELFILIRQQLPTVSIAYVSMKPSPSRQHLLPKMEAGNALIKKYLSKQNKTAYINVFHKMFNNDGTIISDIFIADNLHMNAKGYAIWQKIIAPYLLK
ncbi:MAG: G-D-S-L family lipolytic protein [Ferruginibacter sp.]|nr:G-D-S-L family lipolytic protein [Ferruginibacter sp.]